MIHDSMPRRRAAALVGTLSLGLLLGAPALAQEATPTAGGDLMSMYGPVQGNEEYRLAFLQVYPDLPFWQAMREAVEERAAENGVTVDVRGFDLLRDGRLHAALDILPKCVAKLSVDTSYSTIAAFLAQLLKGRQYDDLQRTVDYLRNMFPNHAGLQELCTTMEIEYLLATARFDKAVTLLTTESSELSDANLARVTGWLLAKGRSKAKAKAKASAKASAGVQAKAKKDSAGVKAKAKAGMKRPASSAQASTAPASQGSPMLASPAGGPRTAIGFAPPVP